MELKHFTIPAFFFAVALILRGLVWPDLALASQDTPRQEAEPDSSAAEVFDQAQEAMGAGNYVRTVELLKEYVELKPEDKVALKQLGQVYSWQANYEQSIVWYDRYLDLAPHDLDLMVEKAQVMGWQGLYSEAEALVRTVLAEEPEHVDGNLLLAGLLEWQGKKKEADKVYSWILKLDPANETAKQGHQELHTGSYQSVEWVTQYLADNQDFWLVSTRLGLRFPVGEKVNLMPYLAGTFLGDAGTSVLPGIGGGMTGGWKINERFYLQGDIGATYYFDANNSVDWGGMLEMDMTLLPELFMLVKFDTFLYGVLGQSTSAISESLRYYRLLLGLYSQVGIFSLYADFSVNFLPGQTPLPPAGQTALVGSEYTDLVLTAQVYPKLKLFGKDWKVHLGYKLWYTSHDERPSQKYGYWSPNQYFSHQLLARLEGLLGERANLYLEAGGGFGHELTWATGIGTAQEKAEEWRYFPVASGGAGVEWTPVAPFTARLGGWLVYSSRDEAGVKLTYVLWNVELGLIYRW